jgi:hypothetical protein
MEMEYINQFAGIIAREGNYVDLEKYLQVRHQLVERIQVQNQLRLEVGLDEMDEPQSKCYIANNVMIDENGFPSSFADNTKILLGMIDDCKKMKLVGAL